VKAGRALLAGTLAMGCRAEPQPAQLRIAAASDLATAMAELAARWHERGGDHVIVTIGSSGLLARQIAAGAPFDAFASAGKSDVDDVVGKGACDRTTVTPYARGLLAVWTRPGVEPPRTLAELAEPRFVRVAIANPEHAPYGRAAREALVAAGVWSALEARVVRADNVRAALTTAESGNAEAAIVAIALLAGPRRGTALPVDPALHAPLEQTLVACGPHGARAHGFIAFVASPDGQEILARYGFAPPLRRSTEGLRPSSAE
jgi:molybdate transport system substrate-binding protein